MTKEMNVKDVDAFMRKLQLLVCGAVAFILVPLIGYAIYLEMRLGEFEGNPSLSLPEQLESEDSLPNQSDHQTANPSMGQIVYVPAYSHVYDGTGKPYLLTITLSVRNTSVENEIVVKSISYFDTKGKKVKSYLDQPVRLPALGTTEVLVERKDTPGGSGANFLVQWYAKTSVAEPIIEAVMIDTNSQQGISFVRRGLVISEAVPDGSSTPESAPETEYNSVTNKPSPLRN